MILATFAYRIIALAIENTLFLSGRMPLEFEFPIMDLNFTALAVPAFFIFLGLEYLAALQQKKSDHFNFESSVSSLSIGIAERLASMFVSASFYGVFVYVYDHWALFNIPNHWTVWVGLILATDLVWYWYHRFGHEINLLWAAHVVHHQSEEFNYTVSARITVFQSVVRNAFWCVLPLAGFQPSMVLTMLVIHGTYSFFTHTRMVGKLGWLEYVLITPSHHRVHHASNEKYLNKNYGDIFIFWDKLFGTFQSEEQEPVYGLTHPLKSHSFIWQHFHYFIELLEGARRATGIRKKIQLIFGRPEMLDASIRGSLEDRLLPKKLFPRTTQRFKAYLKIQIACTSVILFILILLSKYWDAGETMLLSAFILITLVNCGGLIEQRRWIFYLEYARLFIVSGLLSYELQSPVIFVAAVTFVIIILASFPIKRWYWKFMFSQSHQFTKS